LALYRTTLLLQPASAEAGSQNSANAKAKEGKIFIMFSGKPCCLIILFAAQSARP